MSEDFTLELDNKLTISESIYEKLKEAIIIGYYLPGEKLKEQEISDRLGVSRTPVREALTRLENDNLVENLPYKGVQVKKLTIEEAKHIYELHSFLEGLAAEWAIPNIEKEDIEFLKKCIESAEKGYKNGSKKEIIFSNIEFHNRILICSDNQELKYTMERLQNKISLLRVATLSIPDRVEKTIKEHKKIFNSLKKGNKEMARKNARQHMMNAKIIAIEVLKKDKDDIGREEIRPSI